MRWEDEQNALGVWCFESFLLHEFTLGFLLLQRYNKNLSMFMSNRSRSFHLHSKVQNNY